MNRTPLGGQGRFRHFQRYSAPDPDRLAGQIEHARVLLADARACGATLVALDHAATLGELLTIACREQEARALLLEHVSTARAHATEEPAGWLLLALGTANQYLDRGAEANQHFSEALDLARLHHWQELEHYVLHHWGRLFVEEGNFTRARACLSAALQLREALGEPRQASTRRALEELALLEAGA